jgi:hypothetical protein
MLWRVFKKHILVFCISYVFFFSDPAKAAKQLAFYDI